MARRQTELSGMERKSVKEINLGVYRDDEANPPLVVTLLPGKDNVKVAAAGDDVGEEAA